MEGKIKITQIKSVIGESKKKKDTMEALGLRKINQSIIHTANPPILGMIRKVAHLVHTEPSKI